MIHKITDCTDQFFSYLQDDPVRPHIPHDIRVGVNKDIFVIEDQGHPQAITCVAYADYVPEDENELFDKTYQPRVAVFYTIWSYQSGAGRKLIFDVVEYIRQNLPNISRFVTLSPKTEMARKFHIKNGAYQLRENFNTINYEYRVQS